MRSPRDTRVANAPFFGNAGGPQNLQLAAVAVTRRRRGSVVLATTPQVPTVPSGALWLAFILMAILVCASAFAQSTGTMISRTNSIPRGATFLSDQNGGHWWVADQALGICELMPQNVGGQPPFALQNCNGTVKSGGQIVVGTPSPTLALAANIKFVYIADNSTTSVNVVRFAFSPNGNGSFTTNTVLQIPNNTNVGGGLRGGRSVGLALLPNPTGGQDLYVGYLKSGDISKVAKVDSVPLNQSPAAPPAGYSIVGSTSDGKGINSLVAFGNDLYIGEIGGFGVSKIADPSGATRVACTAAAICTAVSLSPNPSFLAGGMATDGAQIFIGDAPFGGVQNRVLSYNPATGASTVYAQSITPSYVAPNPSNVSTTWTTFISPYGLGYNSLNGDLYVTDDPQGASATPTLQQGHVWKVLRPVVAAAPTITSIAPNTGLNGGGTRVTINGTNFSTVAGATLIKFGANAGTNITCATTTSCAATTPSIAPAQGTVDVTAIVGGQTSAISLADQFTYNPPPPNTAIMITSLAPNTGATVGGTTVTITGNNLATYDPLTGIVTALPTISFGVNLATNVACQNSAIVPPVAPIASVCTAVTPAGAAGTVTVSASLPGQTPVANPPADQFTYGTPIATLYAWGITAPKGGAVWLAGALGGHWWSSDHAQGLCRQDAMSTAIAPWSVAGDTNHALNFSACGDDAIGSAGQAVYDPRPNANGTHYVYVPDNAVKSTAVWRLTFDPATETMTVDPFDGLTKATAMLPLTDTRTLKPNGMALGPDGSLYVTDLVDPWIRVISNPNGDPRLQTINIVAGMGDGRGANGTSGFIGNMLYVSGNRASQFFDITKCPSQGNNALAAGFSPCGMASVPAPSAVFIAGTATDAPNKRVYLSNSAGGGPAAIYRYDASFDTYTRFAYGSVPGDAFGVVTCPACTVGPIAVTYLPSTSLLPAIGTPNATVTIATTGQHPWDLVNHPTVGVPAGAGVPTTLAFVFGLATDPTGTLVITEDPTAGARSGRGSMWTVPFIP